MSNSYKRRLLPLAAGQPQNNAADLGAVPAARPSRSPAAPGGGSRGSWLRVAVQGSPCALTRPQAGTPRPCPPASLTLPPSQVAGQAPAFLRCSCMSSVRSRILREERGGGRETRAHTPAHTLARARAFAALEDCSTVERRGALTRDGLGEPRKRDARPAGSVTKGHAVWALVREKLPEQQIQLKQIGGCRGLGPEGKGEQLLTGHGVLFWGERTFRN